jgi:WD40 repeat protein
VALTPGPLRHAAVGAQGKVHVWIDDNRRLFVADAAGQVRHSLRVPDFAWPPARIDLAASGRKLAVVRRYPPTAAVWDLDAPEKSPLRLQGGRLHPLGQHWLVESDRSSLASYLVTLAEPARRLVEFSTAPHGVSGSAFTDDGSMLVLAQEDGALRAWSLAGWPAPGPVRANELGYLQPFDGPVTAPLFDTRGLLVTPHLRGAARWTLPAGPQPQPVWHWLVPSGTGIAPQRAGALDEALGLLAQARGGTLQLWRLEGNEALAPALTLRSPRTQQLAFDRTRRRLLVSSEDEPVEALTLDPRDWRSRACAAAGRNLTCAEWQRFQPTMPYRLLCPALPPPEPACAATAARRTG